MMSWIILPTIFSINSLLVTLKLLFTKLIVEIIVLFINISLFQKNSFFIIRVESV